MLHVTLLSSWTAAPDEPYAPPMPHTEGYALCVPDEPLALAVAGGTPLFRDAAEPIVALAIDVSRLTVPVRHEPAPTPLPGVRDDTRLPRVYGPVDRAAVTEVRYARRDPSGRVAAFERRPALAEALDLLPHPEGGWYRQTWAAPVTFAPPGYGGERASATGIYFLLGPAEESRWHAVRSDELWLWHRGGPLTLLLDGTGDAPAGRPTAVTLGGDVAAGQTPQALVPAGTWQAARPAGTDEALVSCIVSPGFDFADFRAL